MRDDELERRCQRLKDAVDREGSKAELGRKLGYSSGAFVRQMVDGERPITEKTVVALEALPGYGGWFSKPGQRARTAPIEQENNPAYPAIRRVRFKLQAGVSGFAVQDLEDDGPPIVFRRDWFDLHGYRPEKMLAARVAGASMEPSLWDGDLVVINTAQTTPHDGHVYALNIEGVLAIKRLVRDGGEWWIRSDNADKVRYPDKRTHEGVSVLGEVVYKQSERI
jgi:phage repressor protein C with HTH and peptisase S24 domain